MRILRIFGIALAVLVLLAACRKLKSEYRVASPDGSVVAAVSLDSLGSLRIFLSVDNLPFVEVSDMGLQLSDTDYSRGLKLVGASSFSEDSVYTLPWGENKIVQCHCNGLVLNMLHLDGSSVSLRLKVFNDGIGFAYEYDVLAPAADSLLLQEENTRFRFASDGDSWSIPANFESYEFAYRQQSISATDDANTPFTFCLDNGLYGYVHEAALYDMPELALRKSDSLVFGVWLAPSADSAVNYATRVGKHIFTSWRTIGVGRKAVDLINSSLLLSLNGQQKIDPSDWVRPMKYIGIWWGMHLGINSWTPDARHGATTANALRYIDFAAQNNIDAVLFEGWNLGWDSWGGRQHFDFVQPAPDFDVERVIAYADSLGVKIIMHHETGGNIPDYETQVDSAFRWCESHGVHAVKTGYAGGFPNREIHHSRYGVRHYQKVVELAAKYHIMLDVHEPIKPTGICRTYPNLMTAEGARGKEWDAWSDGNSPSHQTILPFTRLLAGPMDYTPGTFDILYRRIQHDPNCRQWNMKDSRLCRTHATIAHEVALWVVIYSPWVMASDLIENYEGHPMFQFFRDYNPDCDWSRALNGELGQYVTVVRRSGEVFFLGAITNEEGRDLVIPLDFLNKGKYEVSIYADSPESHYVSNPQAYAISHRKVMSSDSLSLQLAPGGGAAVCFKPILR